MDDVENNMKFVMPEVYKTLDARIMNCKVFITYFVLPTYFGIFFELNNLVFTPFI